MDEYGSPLEVVKDLFLSAADEDAHCRSYRRHLDRLLGPTVTADPEHRYVLLSSRGRAELRDTITFFTLEVTDLCGLLAAAAVSLSQDLVVRGIRPTDLLDLSSSVRQQAVAQLFTSVGALERYRPLAPD